MNIEQESLAGGFVVGHGGADAVSKPIVAASFASKAYKGVRVRAATANTVVIYIGTRGVTVDNGYPLPAGEELAIPIEDPSKVYVTATPAADCQQTVALAGEIAGDTFTLTFNGETTDPVAVTANAATVLAALVALSTIGVGNCSVVDTAGGPPYTVTFIGDLTKTDVNLMTGTGIGVSETQNVTVTNAAAGDTMVLTLGAESTDPLAYDVTSAQLETALEGLSNIGAGNVTVSDGATGWDIEFAGDLEKSNIDPITGVAGKNEVQNIEIIGGAAGDLLTLTYDGVTGTPIAYDASAVALQANLDLIPALTGKTQVTGGGGTPWDVEFIDTLAKTDVGFISGVCGLNEQQTIGLPDTADTGTFLLSYGGDTTPPIAFNAVAADVQAALETLGDLDATNIETSGGPGPGTDWVVDFKGDLAGTDVALITAISSCGQNEKQTISIPDTVDYGPFTLTYDGATTGLIPHVATAGEVQTALEGLAGIGAGQVSVTGGPGPGTDWVVEFTGTLGLTDVALLTATSSCGQNEEQTIAIDNATTEGTFTLSYDGQPTGPIAYNASAGDVQTALEALVNLGVGQVSVTGGPGPAVDWVVEFTGTLATTDVVTLIGDGSLLVGGSTDVTITESVKGVTETVTIEETVKGVTADVTITEAAKGHSAAVAVAELAKGNQATVTVTETQPGDASCTVTIAKVGDITTGSQYSWLAL